MFLVTIVFVCKHEMIVSALENVELSTIINEQKIIEEVDINDQFDENTAIVVLKPSQSQYTGISVNVSKKLDSIIEVNSISNLTNTVIGNDNPSDSGVMHHLEKADFRQILKINLNTNTKQDVINVIKKIELLDEVLYVGPNYISEGASVTTDDPYLSYQWGLVGSNGIDVENAGEFSVGNNAIRVGVIDSGIASHEDLNDNVVEGYDYYNKNGITTDDFGGHGTSVSGIIGAVGNNGIGVSGTNQNISLVPMQTAYNTERNGYHHNDEVISAIYSAINLWDTDNRISILNYSVSRYGHNTDILSAVKEFQGLFVWSAGNNGENLDDVAGIEDFSLDNLISVGAHDRFNERSIWSSEESSNYGEAVNIYAPGGKGSNQTPHNIYTTYSQSFSSYRYFNGTSAAAPHVTGVAALLLSINPNLTPLQLKNAILNSAETISITIPDGTKQDVKKLNAYNAVKYLFNYYNNQSNLKYNDVNINKYIDGLSPFYSKQNAMIKLYVQKQYEYDFSISSSNAIDVTLYDSDLNILETSKTSFNNKMQIIFSKELYLYGTYYLKVNYINQSLSGTVNITISGMQHTHSYDSWKYYSRIAHIEVCSDCGATGTKTEGHMVRQSEIRNNKANCLGCRILLDLSTDMAMIGFDSTSLKYSINGSYIFSSGIVVLVDEDVDDYLNGTLVFYNKDDLPLTQ